MHRVCLHHFVVCCSAVRCGVCLLLFLFLCSFWFVHISFVFLSLTVCLCCAFACLRFVLQFHSILPHLSVVFVEYQLHAVTLQRILWPLNTGHCFVLFYFISFHFIQSHFAPVSRFSLEIFSYCKLAHRLRQSCGFCIKICSLLYRGLAPMKLLEITITDCSVAVGSIVLFQCGYAT